MPSLGPIRRERLVSYLRRLGFEGPFHGRKHQFMVKGEVSVRLPSPHRGDIAASLLTRILQQANVERDVWERL